MRALTRYAIPLGPLAVALGCATTSPRAPVAEYHGRYTPGFELSRFVACGTEAGDRPWWVILSDVALRQRDSLVAALPADAGAEVFVRWRGTAGPREAAGHLGQSRRYIHVVEILELRPAAPTDCGDGMSRRRTATPVAMRRVVAAGERAGVEIVAPAVVAAGRGHSAAGARS